MLSQAEGYEDGLIDWTATELLRACFVVSVELLVRPERLWSVGRERE